MDTKGYIMRILKDMWIYKETLILILTPIIASPILICLGYPSHVDPDSNSIEGPAARCAYCVLLMAVYWMFEVFPLAVTALLPIFLFPILHILTSNLVCQNYLTDTNFLFVGGLMVALAVERSNLHKRVALKVLTIVGSQKQWIMLGFMSVTAFLSMWISNTATTAMMLPIAESVIRELLKHGSKHRRLSMGLEALRRQSKNLEDLAAEYEGSMVPDEGRPGRKMTVVSMQQYGTLLITSRSLPNIEDYHKASSVSSPFRKLSRPFRKFSRAPRKKSRIEVDIESEDEDEIQMEKLSGTDQGMAKGMLLSIAFAANIGGTGTVTGTPPNIVAVGQLNDKLYPGKNTGISFASWLKFGVLPMIVSVLVCWGFLVIFYLGIKTCISTFKIRKRKTEDEKGVYRLIQSKYKRLPPWSFAEVSVLVCFIVLLLLWIIRDLTFGPLINPLEPSGERINYYTDATSAMLIAILLFAIPSKRPECLCCPGRDLYHDPTKHGALLEWDVVQKKFPWSVVILLGGGFALAEGVKSSGLSNWVGSLLEQIAGALPPLGIQVVCVIITILVTNVTSNTVTASIFIPIVNSLALKLAINPLYLIIPVTLSCSYAFALPVATPPNAIVFASGLIKVSDMMKSGFIMSILAVLLIVFFTNTYMNLILGLGTVPDWALGSLENQTLANALAAERGISL